MPFHTMLVSGVTTSRRSPFSAERIDGAYGVKRHALELDAVAGCALGEGIGAFDGTALLAEHHQITAAQGGKGGLNLILLKPCRHGDFN